MSWRTLVKDYTDEATLTFWLHPTVRNMQFLILGDTDGAIFQMRTRAPGLPAAAVNIKWADNNSNDWMTGQIIDAGGAAGAGLYRFRKISVDLVEVIVSGIGAAADFTIYVDGTMPAQPAS